MKLFLSMGKLILKNSTVLLGRFQVLSMSRLGGAAAVAPLVADINSEVHFYISYILSPKSLNQT